MADTGTGASGAEPGAEPGAAGTASGGTEKPRAYRTGVDRPGGPDPAGTNGPATLREVARIAEERGFGTSRITLPLGGGDVGCVGIGLAFALLLPGIGLLVGPYGQVATTVGITFLAIAVMLPVVVIRYEKYRDNRVPRLHVFDGGMIITHPTRIDAYAWPQIRVVERVDFIAIGQGGAQRQVHRLQLHEVGGGVLCSMGDANNPVEIVRLALAGGAQS